MEIVPTILTSDYVEFLRKMNLAKGIVPRIQVDFIDGKFAENKTVDFEAIKPIFTEEDDNLKIGVDVHLMTKEPLDWISRAMTILPDRIIGQVEMMSDPLSFVNQVIDSGVEVGIALDLGTPVSAVSEEIYHLVDLVLVMGYKAPGFEGTDFDPKVVDKIKEIKKIVGNTAEIAVDGGLDEKNIKLCKEAGATIFYVGKTFWDFPDLLNRYNELTELLNPKS